jgi:hypothetical protein
MEFLVIFFLKPVRICIGEEIFFESTESRTPQNYIQNLMILDGFINSSTGKLF